MYDLQTHNRLAAAVSNAASAKDQALGAFKTLRENIKSEYNVNSLEEAETLLATKQKELAKFEKEYEALYSEFHKKYGKLLT